MIILSGADVVLPDGVRGPTSLVIEGDRITEIAPRALPATAAAHHFDLHGHIVVPGFIDVHVHGSEGTDSLDGAGAIQKIAASLPKYGVTGFCPTTVACDAAALRVVLDEVRAARAAGAARHARVLGAHLESNFINPKYRGAQPETFLLSPAAKGAEDILNEIARAAGDVAIVTLAPELDGSSDLIHRLRKQKIAVSLGHSGATFERAQAAIEAGATQATHLYNRMPPLNHRDPGLAGAVLTRQEVAAEIICDGVHVHTPMIELAIAAKKPARMMAITDGTAAAGLPEGSTAALGNRSICVRDGAAYLDDGTLAGSVATMDLVFWFLVKQVGLPLADAVQMCSTTPARELGLRDRGTIAVGAPADVVVLDSKLSVVQTYVAGQLAFSEI